MNPFYVVLDWLGAERYLPHSICLTRDPIIMTLYVAGDAVIFASYFIIGGILLVQYARHVTLDIPQHLRVLYGAFIFLCGLTHLTKTITLFSGIYRLDVIAVVATAAVSATTAAFAAISYASKESERVAEHS